MNKKKVKILITNKALWNRYRRFTKNAYIDLRGADLRGADLRGADLRGADLSRADLREADLSRADLRGVDLNWTDLRGADLRGADLREANLDFAVLPLWCGSFDMIVDENFTEQLLLHIYKLNSEHPKFGLMKEFIEPYIRECKTVKKHSCIKLK
jgi:hypothetical protein